MTQTSTTPPCFAPGAGISDPAGADITRVSIARYRNHCQHGKDNYSADRALSEVVAEIVPDWPRLVLAAIAWSYRVVTHLAAQGIDQILELNTGLPDPSYRYLHTAARTDRREPTHVVYTDPDPLCAAYGRALLENPSDGIYFVQADPTSAESLLSADKAGRFLDLTRPVGLVMTDLVHHIPDTAHPAAIMRDYITALVPGSHVALAHYCRPDTPAGHQTADRLAEVHQRALGSGWFRNPDIIRSFFTGLDLLDPGLVPPAAWRPDRPWPVPDPAHTGLILAGVAVKRDAR